MTLRIKMLLALLPVALVLMLVGFLAVIVGVGRCAPVDR